MKKRIQIALVAALVAWAGSQAVAGGWPQPKGQGFYKLGFRLVRATQFYEPDGNRIAIPTLGDYTTSLYGEYGITGRLTAIAYVPFFKRITLNRQVGRESGFVFFKGDSTSGIADLDVGLRFGLVNAGATVISAGLMLGLPVGESQQRNGLLTGDGEFNQLATLQLGHSFYPAPAYLSASVGFNNRTGGYSDEFRYSIEAGYSLSDRLSLLVRATGVESLDNGVASVTGGMGGLYANNQRYLAIGPEVGYAVNDRFGVSAGVDVATRARNVLSAPAFSFGIWVK